MKTLKIFLSILILTFVSITVQAQTGQTGAQNFDYEIQWLCDSASQTTFYRVHLYRIGFAPVVAGTFKPDGTTYSPTSTIKSGPCSTGGGGSFPDSTYAYNYIEMCDLTVNAGYIKIYKQATANSNGGTVRSLVGNFSPITGLSFSPGTNGSQMLGWCNVHSIDTGGKVLVLQTTASTGTLTYATSSISSDILNVGYNIARLTINGVNYDLLPGERWFCHSKVDQGNMKQIRCPAVTYDANYNSLATTLHITRTGH